MKLKATVHRGPKKKGERSQVKTSVDARVDIFQPSVSIGFFIDAGTGKSRISVRLPKSDIIAILKEVAKSMPGMAHDFAECSEIAAGKMAEEIKKLPATSNLIEKTRRRKAVEVIGLPRVNTDRQQ